MRPLVSLVTPVYNGMPYFREYLDSVLAQTWRPLEFICIDDGSEDDSFEFLESLRPKFEESGIVLHHKRMEHGGQAKAVNEALKIVSGDFLAWCDADDILLPENIEKKALFLMSHPHVGMVRNDGVCRKNGRDIGIDSRPEDRKQQVIFDALFHDVTYCYAGCYMLRTSLFFECYADKNIPISMEGQNLQLLLPPASRTECGFLPDRLHIYRQHSDSHSNRERSFTEQIHRLENFTVLKTKLLDFCICDKEFYKAEALKIERERRLRLIHSATQRIREERKHENRNFDIS